MPDTTMSIAGRRSPRNNSASRIAMLAACLFLMLPAAPAFASGSYAVVLGPAESPDKNVTNNFGNVSTAATITSKGNNSGGAWDGFVDIRASVTGVTAAKSFISGTRAATAQATIVNRIGGYLLTPPEGANFAGGKVIVYATLPRGDVRGNASLALKLDVTVLGPPWQAKGSGERSIPDQPGNETVEIPVVVDLPTTLDSTAEALVDFTLTLKANAAITPAAGAADTAIADTGSGASLSGFRVLNAKGVQIPGFTLGQIPERPPAPAGLSRAIEFYNPAFGHYFITAGVEEIAKLDSGAIAGWQRTGEAFSVYVATDSGRAGVCRFFAEFGTVSSHFYAPRGLGCEGTLTNPVWRYEGDVFFVRLPDAAGGCPTGTVPVYRVYNNGKGGAPNHRFTASEATWLDMKRDGWLPEGAGPGIGWCSPE